jgi:hypothetical protein
MSRLNGIWKFYYSKEQLGENKKLANEISSKLEGFTLEKTYVEINGKFYPCKPDIFAKTYDPVEEGESERK